MAKKITKSTAHANALIAHMTKIRAEFDRMIEASRKDTSMGEKERIEDIALFERQIAQCNKMIAWWQADIASNAEAEKAAKASKADAKPEKAAKTA